jgi:hypothetical protein
MVEEALAKILLVAWRAARKCFTQDDERDNEPEVGAGEKLEIAHTSRVDEDTGVIQRHFLGRRASMQFPKVSEPYRTSGSSHAPLPAPSSEHYGRLPRLEGRYVDPWAIEYNPNPVIFPHLQTLAQSAVENLKGRFVFDLAEYLDWSALQESSADASFRTRDALVPVNHEGGLTVDENIPLESPKTKSEYSPSILEEASSPPATSKNSGLQCPECGISFRTKGLRK